MKVIDSTQTPATDEGYCSRIKMVKDKQCGSSKPHVRSYRLLNRHKTRTTAQFKQVIKYEAKNLQNSKFVDDIDMSKISRRWGKSAKEEKHLNNSKDPGSF